MKQKPKPLQLFIKNKQLHNYIVLFIAFILMLFFAGCSNSGNQNVGTSDSTKNINNDTSRQVAGNPPPATILLPEFNIPKDTLQKWYNFVNTGNKHRFKVIFSTYFLSNPIQFNKGECELIASVYDIDHRPGLNGFSYEDTFIPTKDDTVEYNPFYTTNLEFDVTQLKPSDCTVNLVLTPIIINSKDPKSKYYLDFNTNPEGKVGCCNSPLNPSPPSQPVGGQ